MSNIETPEQALRKIAGVCQPGTWHFGGVDIGAEARDALAGRCSERAALSRIEKACRGTIRVEQVDIGETARAGLVAVSPSRWWQFWK